MARARRATDGNGTVYIAIECKGCDERHTVVVARGIGDIGPVWGFNGSLELPTFTPSLRVTWPANPNAIAGFEEWRTERCCHSFVADGRIQYLGDCTHSLAGQTIDLPEISGVE